MKAELPGLKKENVEIEVGKNELSLTAKSEVEREEKGKNYLHRERAFSTFRRYIGLAEGVDTGKISLLWLMASSKLNFPNSSPSLKRKEES